MKTCCEKCINVGRRGEWTGCTDMGCPCHAKPEEGVIMAYGCRCSLLNRAEKEMKKTCHHKDRACHALDFNEKRCSPEVPPEKEKEYCIKSFCRTIGQTPCLGHTPQEKKTEDDDWQQKLCDLITPLIERISTKKGFETYAIERKVKDFIAAQKEKWEASLKQKMREETRIALLLLANRLGIPEKTAKKEIEIILLSLIDTL